MRESAVHLNIVQILPVVWNPELRGDGSTWELKVDPRIHGGRSLYSVSYCHIHCLPCNRCLVNNFLWMNIESEGRWGLRFEGTSGSQILLRLYYLFSQNPVIRLFCSLFSKFRDSREDEQFITHLMNGARPRGSWQNVIGSCSIPVRTVGINPWSGSCL